MSEDFDSYEMSPADNVLYFGKNIDVRICPKNAMSTMKKAIRIFHGKDGKDIRDSEGRQVGNYKWRHYHSRKYSDQFDMPFRKNSLRIAIRRDPVDRFRSACEFIQRKREYFISKGRQLPELSLQIDDVLNDLEKGTLKNNHFYTQSWYMGHVSDYDMVFHIDETYKALAFLKNSCNIEHGDFEKLAVNRTRSKLYNDALSPEQTDRIRELYNKDFKNGWCKLQDRNSV